MISFTVMMFCLVTYYVVMPGSCGFRQWPSRLHQQPQRSVSPIRNGHRLLQKFPGDWFPAEQAAICFRATLALQ
jgi:hypothetical protein